jgi:hypothetical protein
MEEVTKWLCAFLTSPPLPLQSENSPHPPTHNPIIDSILSLIPTLLNTVEQITKQLNNYSHLSTFICLLFSSLFFFVCALTLSFVLSSSL